MEKFDVVYTKNMGSYRVQVRHSFRLNLFGSVVFWVEFIPMFESLYHSSFSKALQEAETWIEQDLLLLKNELDKKIVLECLDYFESHFQNNFS